MYLKYNHLFIFFIYFASKNCFIIIVIIFLHAKKYDKNYGKI